MVKKIEEFFWYVFLFVLPWQTRIVIFQTDWYFNEYKAGFLYATDILLAILLVFWLRRFHVRISRPQWWLIAFFLIGGLSIYQSSNVRLSSYQFLKLAEFLGLYFYIANYAWKRFELNKSLLAIITGGIFQSIIAIIQFIRQSSLGLAFTGESVFNNDYSGVAAFILESGDKIIRAYGTAPHPNVLAAYLLAVIFGFYVFYYRTSPGHPKILLGAYSLLIFGLLVTFSRTVLAVWLVFSGFGLIWRIRKDRKKTVALMVTTIAAGIIFIAAFPSEVMSRIRISRQDEAVTERIYLNKETLRLKGEKTNWLGVGIGNFVPWLMDSAPGFNRMHYQPTHNIYLLMYAEIGILGLAAFIMFIFFTFKKAVKLLKGQASLEQFWVILGVGAFLAIGLLDHFFWTLQQGRLLFWMALGLMAASFAFQKNRIPLDIHEGRRSEN
ncbi:MAG: O-antigen ligase family protein [Candidatus Yanofskybacteria bacterium]|nr:O-antigen ligase family protein [Candidatus Yanofskybacteria bacterium]